VKSTPRGSTLAGDAHAASASGHAHETPISRRDAVRRAAGVVAGVMATPGVLQSTSAVRAAQPARELLIRGGRVVNADGVVDADVRIVGETIAEVGPRLRAGTEARVIDARGKLLIPGGFDPHTHLQPAFVDDLTSGSRAALAGGITTVGTFSSPRQGETPLAALDRMEALVREQAIADVILHTMAGTPRPEFIEWLPRLVERGQPSIKVFMLGADFGASVPAFLQLLEAARVAGVVTLMHCEDGALLAAAARKLEHEGRTALANYGESRPLIAEVSATQQAAAWCEATRAPMHVVHLSSGRALDAIRAAKRAGAPMTVETRPLYIHLTDEVMRGPDAPLYVGQPPLRGREEVEAMWKGLLDGTIDFLATDHAPWRREQKLDPSLTITRLRPGVSNLQHMLPMYWSEGVRVRRMPMERFVATTSTNAARRFGLYPRKGMIRVGSDADVVVWDPAKTGVVRGADDLSNADYSVYEGRAVTGWPVMVVRRGEVVVEGTEVRGVAGGGRVVRRARHSS
jgi:dihydropyrimidinase